MSTIIDTHTHLYDTDGIDAVLQASLQAGVSDVVALGVDLSSNIKHMDIARQHLGGPHIHLALGLHPGNITAEEIEACFPFFRDTLARQDLKIVAMGETGLDFWYKWVRKDEAKKNEQRGVFQQHLDLARAFDLPVVIHSRGAWRECLEMTLASGIKKADFHWYSGPVDVLKDILDAGFMMSVSPALEYSPEAQKAAAFAPLDRILIETDTPVMVTGPDNVRIPSTPKDVWRTFKALCAIKTLEENAALAVLNANARAFFNI